MNVAKNFIRHRIFFIFLISNIIFFFGGKAYADSLVWIEVSPTQRPVFQELSIPVYWNLETGFFVPLNEAQLQILQAKGFKIDILDTEISSGEYFLVFKVGFGENSYPGRLLWENTRLRLVRLQESEAIYAKTSGFEMVHLPSLPHPLGSTEPCQTMTFPSADTTIQRLVDMVSESNLSQTILDLQNFGTRCSYSPHCDSTALYIYHRFVNLGLATDYDLYMLGSDSSYNICATYPGQIHPESIVIACGHFDSFSNQPMTLAPGADDDASGIAAVIEAANALATAQFRWTVKYLAFSGEEQWMVGSTHWVEYVALPQNLNIAGVYNLDMIGYPATDTNLLYVTPNTPSQSLAVLAETVNAQYDIGLNLVNYLDDDAAGDHTPFWQYGYEAVFVIEDSEWGIWGGSNPYYHTAYDTLGNLHMALVRRATQVAIACLATMAGPMTEPNVNENLSQNVAAPSQEIFIEPNPMRKTCLITYPCPAGADCKLAIYDASGRLIKNLQLPTLYCLAPTTLNWDGKDNFGRGVKSGVYFVRYQDRKRPITAKLVMVK